MLIAGVEPPLETTGAVPVTLVTPVLLTVTLPVEPDTDMPVPAERAVTPVLAMVTEPAPSVIEMPVPSVKFAFFHTPVGVVVAS